MSPQTWSVRLAAASLRTSLPDRLLGRAASLPFRLVVHTVDGRVVRLGEGPQTVEVQVRTRAGARALRSMSELEIAEAYVRGDLDLDGDLILAMSLRDLLTDAKPWIRLWARLQPALLGRTRCNPSWVAKHYDAGNVQLLAADSEYNTYTPGIYEKDDDSLEVGARRKLDHALAALGAGPGARVLDVGCGWGGFLRHCAGRGVHATGITLSRHQFDYARSRVPEDVPGSVEVRLADFFSYEPARRFDGISLMGVIEDLSDYRRVLRRITRWLEPGGRVYCDFAAANVRFSTSSFITRHIWPGTFRMVYLPEFTEALAGSRFDIVEMHNDRRNYHLWTRGLHERWVRRRAEVTQVTGEETWRLFRLLFAGVASIMSPLTDRATAYRLVLESRRTTALRRDERSGEPARAPAAMRPTTS
jgi:cyclopropane-fatty-acyl-phospholipid synthase